jgi:hypothetical protein
VSAEREAERATVHDVATVAAYLRTVHASAIAAGVPAWLVVSEYLPRPEALPEGAPWSRYLSWSWRLDDVDSTADACVRISDRAANCYTRVHLVDRFIGGKLERGAGVDTRWVSHFAGDVDIAGPGHRVDNLPDSLDEAVAIVDATLAPSLIVSSGGGIYPHYILREVVEIIDDEVRERVRNVGRRLDDAMRLHGRHIDSTCLDMARIVRPAGVMNHKRDRDARPVTILRGNGYGAPTYTLDELDELLPPLPERAARQRHGRSNGARSTSTTRSREQQADSRWSIFDERYTLADVLDRDPLWKWEQTRDVRGEEAWVRVGSSSDYSLRRHPTTGAVKVWSSTLAARLGIEPGDAVDLWGLAMRLAGREPLRTTDRGAA